MKTKLTVLLSMMIIVAMTSKAQTPTTTVSTAGGTTFGIRAGVNFQNLNGKDVDGDKISGNTLKPGFNAGLNVEIPVAPDYYVQPGVLFSTKGAKSDDIKTNLSYIEVPVNFVYKPALGTSRLILGFGPYAGFAVGGKVTGPSYDKNIKFQNTVTPTEALTGDPYLKRFDAGANLLAGLELSSKLSFQLNAQLGMLNIKPKYDGSTNDKSTLKNTGFGLSAGYRF